MEGPGLGGIRFGWDQSAERQRVPSGYEHAS